MFLHFHQHSKEISDRYSGLIKRMLLRAIVFGLATIGRAEESISASEEVSTHLKLRSRCTHDSTLSSPKGHEGRDEWWRRQREWEWWRVLGPEHAAKACQLLQ